MPARTGRMGSRRGRANFLRKGTNNVECDRSGFKIKATEGRKEWNGYFVYKKFWERRQPQDFLRGFPDRQQPDVSRPGTGDVFRVETTLMPGTTPDPVTASDPPPTVVSRNDVLPDDL